MGENNRVFRITKQKKTKYQSARPKILKLLLSALLVKVQAGRFASRFGGNNPALQTRKQHGMGAKAGCGATAASISCSHVTASCCTELQNEPITFLPRRRRRCCCCCCWCGDRRVVITTWRANS